MATLLDSTCYLLLALNRAHRTALTVGLATLDLHPGAEVALAELCRQGEISHSRLAEELGVSRPTVTKVSRSLERAGYVERFGDPDDGRVSRLRPTQRGRQVRPAVERAWRAAERETLAALSAEERETLHRLLARALGSVRG